MADNRAGRIGNTTVSGGAGVVTAGDTTGKVGSTTVSGGGRVKANSGIGAVTPNSTLSSAKQSGSGAANFSPTGGNPMTGGSGAAQQVPGGYSPIRETLRSRGVDNSRIGWDNGTVTLDGEGVYTPQYNVDGTTYADEFAINDMTRRAYSNAGEPLVGVRDYATSNGGYGGLVDWDGSNATVGGVPIDTVYVQDGNAYAAESDVMAAIDQMERNNGLLGNDGVTRSYEDRYGSAVDDALDTLLSRGAWDYDPDNDLAWQAYKEQYTQLGDDAFRRAMNANNSSVYGASGAALSEALAARNNYMQELSYKLPELMRDDYDRYTGETNRLRANLADAQGVANDYYERTYRQNRDTYDDLRQSWLDERDEEHWQTEDMRNAAAASAQLEAQQRQNELLGQQVYQGDIYNRYYDPLMAQELRSATGANDLVDRQIKSADIENIMQTASVRGMFSPEEAEFLGLRYDPLTGKAYDSLGREVTPISGAVEYKTLMAMVPAYANQRAIEEGLLIP